MSEIYKTPGNKSLIILLTIKRRFLKFTMKNILFALAFLILSVSFAFGQMDKEAQQKSIEAQRAEMKKLDKWIGHWSGSGWIQQGKERENFTGTETIQRKLDGLAILVEGKFTNKENVVIHETLAVLSYNLRTKIYDFHTYLGTGNRGQFEFKAVEGGWQWGMKFPGGEIRYLTKLTDDTWFETGEMTQDEGKTWRKFFEMELKKVK